MTTDRAILLMAYGTPEQPADIEPYFTHIRGGRRPSPAAVAALAERYALVGGATPLRRITEQVAAGLQKRLDVLNSQHTVYVGMKHWHPFIGDTVRRMDADGVREVTALVLAPHYSRMSVGAYRHAIDEANAALSDPLRVRMVERWHHEPAFVRMTSRLVQEGIRAFPPDAQADVMVVFSAHSLPVRIRDWNDPYEQELMTSSAAVADAARLGSWRFAWQSAGGTSEPWLGPDILDYLDTLQAEGVRNVLQVPIGFVSDHLEILYDIDIAAKEKARALGMRLERTALPNASDELIDVLAAVVLGQTGAAH